MTCFKKDKKMPRARKLFQQTSKQKRDSKLFGQFLKIVVTIGAALISFLFGLIVNAYKSYQKKRQAKENK